MKIDTAIAEVKQAALEGEKNLKNHPPEAARADHPGHPGHLHLAMELLRRAQHDLAQEEDNAQSRGPRQRSLKHVERAIHFTERAIQDLRQGR
ncbi:MAG: hypothetical protein JO006_13395 [Paucibacter sp.]|nr:hypothetical protein [Roseateles sp.]